MTLRITRECFFRRLAAIASLAAALSLLWVAGPIESRAKAIKQETPPTQGIALPFVDADRGRQLFVIKGCVICHAINDVGGKAGPALDAESTGPYVDIFDFAARMWRGAAAMVVLQEMEFGYQIDLTGEELADIAIFVADETAQSKFTERDIPEFIKDWMTDEGTYQRLEELRQELRDMVQ